MPIIRSLFNPVKAFSGKVKRFCAVSVVLTPARDSKLDPHSTGVKSSTRASQLDHTLSSTQLVRLLPDRHTLEVSPQAHDAGSLSVRELSNEITHEYNYQTH